MPKFSTIRNGDVLFDCHRYRMGDTTSTTMGTWTVRVIKVQKNGAMVSWNGNEPKFWFIRSLEKLRRSRPSVDEARGR